MTRPSPKRIRELLEYDKVTGLFRWCAPSSHQKVGWHAGSKGVRYYWRIWIDDRHYMAHVIAWVIVKGRWPTHEVEHRNRDQSNTKWRNLRAATRAQNCMNRSRSKHNTTGFRGVSRFGCRFRATIGVANKRISLGLFDDAAEAAKARISAEKYHYGEFAP